MADGIAKQYKTKDKPNGFNRAGAYDDEDAGETSPRDHKPEVPSKSDDNNNRKRPVSDAKETIGVGKKPASVGESETRRDGATRKQQEAYATDFDDVGRSVGDKKDLKKKEELKERNGDKSDESKPTGPSAADSRGKNTVDTSRGGQKKTPDKFDEKVTTNGGERDAKQPDGKKPVDRETNDKKPPDDGAVMRRSDETPGRMTNGNETIRRTADDDKDDHKTKASPAVANGAGKTGPGNKRAVTERYREEGGEYDDAEHDAMLSGTRDDGSMTRRNGPAAVNGAKQHQVGGEVLGRTPVVKKSDTLPKQSNGAHQPQQHGQQKAAGGVKKLSSSDQMTGDEDDTVEDVNVKRRTFTGKSTLHHGE